MDKITKEEFKKYLTQGLIMGSILAGFTPTKKDDQVIALAIQIGSEPDKFDQICAILGITD